MSKILIKNAKIVNEEKIFESDLLIKGDEIFEISEEIKVESDFIVIDAKGKILIPGIIDDQVHFREPGLILKQQLLMN